MQELLYLLVTIAIIVTVHEMGHFLAARLVGIRVDVFSIGMGPRLVGYMRGRGWRLGPLPPQWLGQGQTDYRLSLLPIGGYVRIAGMVEEDPENAGRPPQPWEFRAKKPWQKALVLSAGVLMNLLTALLLFAAVAFFEGGQEWHSTTVAYVAPDSFGQKLGLRPGDRLISVDGKAVQTWNQLVEALLNPLVGEYRLLELERPAGGQRMRLAIPRAELVELLTTQRTLEMLPAPSRVVLMAVDELRPAGRAGLRAGDTLLRIEQDSIVATTQFIGLLQRYRQQEFTLSWKRGSDTLTARLRTDPDGKIGVQITTVYTGPQSPVSYAIPQALGIGVQSVGRLIAGFAHAAVALVGGKLSLRESVGGPVRIAQMATEQARIGVIAFVLFVAQLSVMLALINMLPLPALDGGHLLLVTIEALLRREIPVRIKLTLQQIGVALLAMLMLLVLWNDLRR